MGLLDEMKLVRKVKSVAQNVVDENKGSEPMWATVRAVDGTTGRPTVQVDGGELVECDSWANECFVGDRVMIEVRNHKVIQTSNATNKSVGKARLDVLEDSIEAEISDLDEGLRTLITATANGVLTAVSIAIQSTTQLWFAKSTSAKPGKPYSEITQDQNVYVEWTSAVPAYNASYPYYFYCYQYMLADGSFEWSDVVYDSTIKDAKSAADAAAAAAANAAAAAEDAQDTADEANEKADFLSTMVREYRDGVLVCKTSSSVGALVNADGSFDAVKVTWNGDTPTAGNKLSSFSEDSVDFFLGLANKVASITAYSENSTLKSDGMKLDFTESQSNEDVYIQGQYGYYPSDPSIRGAQLMLNALETSGTYDYQGYLELRAGMTPMNRNGEVILGARTGNQVSTVSLSGGTISFYSSISQYGFERCAANTVLAAPNGNTGTATFRSLVAADIPSLNASKIGAGKIPIEHGGTNATTASGARSNLGIFPEVTTSETSFGSATISSDNTWTNVGTASFAAGTWLIVTRFTFAPSGDTTAARWCGAYVGTRRPNDSPGPNVMAGGFNNNNGNYVVFDVTTIETFSSSTTVRAHAKKSSSANQTVSATYRAIRLY